jgi:hypothetical protein
VAKEGSNGCCRRRSAEFFLFLILFIKIYKKIVLTKPHGRYLEERFFFFWQTAIDTSLMVGRQQGYI